MNEGKTRIVTFDGGEGLVGLSKRSSELRQDAELCRLPYRPKPQQRAVARHQQSHQLVFVAKVLVQLLARVENSAKYLVVAANAVIIKS